MTTTNATILVVSPPPQPSRSKMVEVASVATAARNANIAAGLSVTQLGSATCPDRERLERFIAEMSQRGG